MSVMQGRGGIPHVFRATITTTGRKRDLPFFTNYVIFRLKAGTANNCRLFFTEADFNDDANYIEVVPPSTTENSGEWRGPVETDNLWFKSVVGDSDVEVVAFQRRG